MYYSKGGDTVPDRIIRESICTSDTLNELSDFEERFWNRLIVNCDDYGIFDARPAVLKARLFPLRESLTFKNIADALNRLASVGLIELYQVDGKPYLRVVTWERYQRIRAKKSKFPQPDGSCCQMTANDSKCPRNPIQSNANADADADAKSGVNPDLAVVMDAYMNRINPMPSEICIGEMKGFLASMGRDVCLTAIQIAQDKRITDWGYVRKILRNKQSQGVKCLADWDRIEEEREQNGSPDNYWTK